MRNAQKPKNKTKKKLRAVSALHRVLCSVLILAMTFSPATVFANPSGGQVVAGDATITGQSSSHVKIYQSSNRAAINWDDFSIEADERTTFYQPGKNAVVFNRITGGNASQIMGRLNANGQIIITNPNGILFGKGSKVDAAGLVATTHDASTDDFMAGGDLRFETSDKAVAGATVVNEGSIKLRKGGSAAFVAPSVRNSGVISANLGKVQLGAGHGFTLDLYGDELVSFKLGDEISGTLLTSDGTPVKALVENDGTINAKGGAVYLTASAAQDVINQAVNVTGAVNVSHVSKKGGKIILSSGNAAGDATGLVHVDRGALLQATGKTGGDITATARHVKLTGAALDASGKQGGGKIRLGGEWQGGEGLARAKNATVDQDTTIKADATKYGNGGSIVVWSDVYTVYEGALSARGGKKGGHGGMAEVSGKLYLDFRGTSDLSAPKGLVGSLLLDPQDLTIASALGGNPAANCDATVICEPSGDSSVLLASTLEALLASGNVEVTTGNPAVGSENGDIIFDADVTWSTANRLVVTAYNDIIINPGVTISNTTAADLSGMDIPVLLALRADATSINNGGTFDNNGEIDFSSSVGAVSIFYDDSGYGGAPNLGVLTSNGGWTAPTNYTVSDQITSYELVNTAADVLSMSDDLTINYALGQDIDNAGADVQLGAFSGILDGQYCVLMGTAAGCALQDLTVMAAAGDTSVGFFDSISAAGIVRNLSMDSVLTQDFTSAALGRQGLIAGLNSGDIANVTLTGDLNYSASASGGETRIGGAVGEHTGFMYNTSATIDIEATDLVGGANASAFSVGGLIGYTSGSGQTVLSSTGGDVAYIYKGGSSTRAQVNIGGLIGQNLSGSTRSSLVTSSSADVSAYYFDDSYKIYEISANVGGLIGRSGASTTAFINSSSASGSVYSELQGATSEQNVGGLAGLLDSSFANAIQASSATGSVEYTGERSASVGGLIGKVQGTGQVASSNASGDVLLHILVADASAFHVGGLVGQTAQSVINSFATGDVTAIADAGNGNSNVGGLIGFTDDAVTATTGSYATGDVSYTGPRNASVGGLIGVNSNGGLIDDTYAEGNVSAETTATSALKSYYVGGLVGSNTNGTISNSYSQLGTVTGTGSDSGTATAILNLGGLVGLQAGTTGVISDSWSDQDVNYVYKSTSSAEQYGRIGGLVGFNASSAANSILDSEAYGLVSARYFDASYSSSTATVYAGGLVGQLGAANNASTNGNTASGNVYSEMKGGTVLAQALGGLVGYSDSTSGTVMEDSHASGDVEYYGEANANVGGLAGYVISPSAIIGGGSTASGDVSATYTGSTTQGLNLGGLVGRLNGEISDARTTGGSVTFTALNTTGSFLTIMGGLVGNLDVSGIIDSADAVGDVTFIGQAANVNQQSLAMGGLVGLSFSTATPGVFDSTASGNVLAGYFDAAASVTPINGYIGGAVGYNGLSTNTSIGRVTATGNVTSYLQGALTEQHVGGLVGRNDSTSSNSIELSYAYGDVTYMGTRGSSVGGLVGVSLQPSSGIDDSEAHGNVAVTYTGSTLETTSVGGFIGNNFGDLTNVLSGVGTVTVTSEATGSADTRFYIGGLAGVHSGNSLVDQANADKDISYIHKGTSSGLNRTFIGGLIGADTEATIVDSYATGDITADYFDASYDSQLIDLAIGGLVGRFGFSGATSIDTSYATGNIFNTLNGDAQYYFGGLVGWHDSTSAITDSYALGLVSNTGTGVISPEIGSLVGTITQGSGSIVSSFATGFLEAGADDTATGGLAGASIGTVTDSYWDTDTTGYAVSAGGTGLDTATLQNALQAGFGGAWGIVSDEMYPYLLWQGSPQAVSGIVYSDYGTTAMGGANQTGLLINGTDQRNRYTGANGYYYYMLDTATIGAGTNMVAYLTGATKANTFSDADTDTVTDFDLYGSTLRIYTDSGDLTTTVANLNTALGGASGANFPYMTGASLTMDNDVSLYINYEVGADHDLAVVLTGGNATLEIESDQTIRQSAIVSTPRILFSGTGEFDYSVFENNIDVVASSAGNLLDLSVAGDLLVGSVRGVDGITNKGVITLEAGDTVTLDYAVSSTNDDITIASAAFSNNVGAAGIVASGVGKRFLVWSTDPSDDDRGGLAHDFKQYNATYGVTAVAGSGDGFLYTLAPTLAVGLTGTVSKIYNGNTAASIADANYTVSGLIDGDTHDVTALPNSGSYDNENVGTGKQVTVNGITSAGVSNGAATVYGYQVNSSAMANIGTITARQLSIGGSFTANDKVYNSLTNASFASNSLSLVGTFVIGDVVNLSARADFVDKNAGTGKTVNLLNSFLSGPDASNYAINFTGAPTTTADITARALTIGGSFTVSNKIYDSLTTAGISGNSLTLNNTIGGDDINLSAVADFADKNVGTGKSVNLLGSGLAGVDAGNYAINFAGAPSAVADITPFALSVGGSFTANDKVFDGTTAASIAMNSLTLNSVFGGDVVNLTSVAAFDSPNYGLNKTVRLLGSSLNGVDSGNYSLLLDGMTPTASANITLDASGDLEERAADYFLRQSIAESASNVSRRDGIDKLIRFKTNRFGEYESMVIPPFCTQQIGSGGGALSIFCNGGI